MQLTTSRVPAMYIGARLAFLGPLVRELPWATLWPPTLASGLIAAAHNSCPAILLKLLCSSEFRKLASASHPLSMTILLLKKEDNVISVEGKAKKNQSWVEGSSAVTCAIPTNEK